MSSRVKGWDERFKTARAMHIDGFEDVYAKWEKKRKQAKNPSAAQQKNGKKEQFVKEQLALERRMDAIIDWDRGARLEKKTDDIKIDTGAIRAKQEEDSKLIRGLADQLETDRGTMNKFDRVNSGAALPDRLPDQTARERLAIVYGEIRRLQSEGKNLRPEVAAELRAQRPAAAKGRGRGRGSASKPTAGGKDSSAGQTKLADHFGKSPPTPSTDVPSPTPTSTDVPSPAIASATDTCTDTDGGPFVLTIRRHHDKALRIACEADASCLDVRCDAAREIQCDHWEIKLANGPFTLSDETPASAYKGQTLWVKKA